MTAKILWIEGRRAGGPDFVPKLRSKGYDLDVVSTGKSALARVGAILPDLIVVDAASLRTSGTRICQSLQNEVDGVPILLIVDEDRPAPDDVSAHVVLQLPFTIRKLTNRIVSFLPGGSERVLKLGPIHLDQERRQLRCEDREAHLTPRLTRLLSVLMERPGEVIERKQLFRRVWRTGYTGDTRTLDVHISWLRKALEADPRKPNFLKTIRGVGYRLDVDRK
jgi:DNA-binding response OmpR family regulator